MSIEDCVEKLEQLLIDENRLVTYKLLSRELKIHVNKAKQCMFDFLTMKNLKDIRLEAYYFLAGFIEKDGVRSTRVVVVSQDKLESVKKEFKQLTSCHIYSLNRGKLRNDCALYTTDFVYKNAEEQSKYSAIKHPNIEIQPPVLNKMHFLKQEGKADLPKKPETSALEKSSSSGMWMKKDGKAELSKEKHSVEVENNKSTETSNGNKSSPEEKSKKGTLMSMWSKKEEISNVAKKEVSKLEKGKQSQMKNTGKNNILSMFSKQVEKNAEMAIKKENNANLVIIENEKKHLEQEIKNKTCNTIRVKVEDKPAKSIVQKRKSSNRKSSRTSKHESDSDSDKDFRPKKKKHRRICTFEDSDSESGCEEEQDRTQRNLLMPEKPTEAPMAASDDSEEPIPPTPPVPANKIKGKVWRSVQKTYQDEDGFFVTKKEKELVSEPEDGEEEPLKEKTKKPPEQDIPVKPFFHSKQASLTRFFTKK